MLDKNNPLQMEMLKAGYTELTKISERIDRFHKKEYEKHCKMIKELNDIIVSDTNGKDGEQ